MAEAAALEHSTSAELQLSAEEHVRQLQQTVRSLTAELDEANDFVELSHATELDKMALEREAGLNQLLLKKMSLKIAGMQRSLSQANSPMTPATPTLLPPSGSPTMEGIKRLVEEHKEIGELREELENTRTQLAQAQRSLRDVLHVEEAARYELECEIEELREELMLVEEEKDQVAAPDKVALGLLR